MSTYFIEKKFKFEASHRLMNMSSGHPCACIHGHSYLVIVRIEKQTLNGQGFVIDFGELRKFQKWLNDNFDHAIILSLDDKDMLNFMDSKNQKMYVMPPNQNCSAEYMAKLFAEEIQEMFSDLYLTKIEVRVQETENNIAGYII
jgi:6-pyruvoyl tetrahydropterin synthase/QueD family protein